MKHTVALCGSYGGGSIEKILQTFSSKGVTQASLVGREITLQIHSESLDDIKKSLSSMGVSNLNVLEWKKTGVTLSGSGKGMDSEKRVSVSLIPSTLDEGLKPLAFLCETEVEREYVEKLSEKIEAILKDAGVTDALYTVHIKGNFGLDFLVEAVTAATLNAIFDAGGLVSIE